MTDIDKLQGVWNIVALEMDARAIPASMLGGAKIAIEGARFTSTGMGAEYNGTVEIDERASPRHFDLKFETGPEKGNTNRGIYELDGDTWRICLATRGPNRPAEFTTKAGTGIALEVLKRGGAAVAAAATEGASFADTRFDPAPELEGEWSMLSGVLNGDPFDKSLMRVARRVVETTSQGSETSVFFGPQLYAKARLKVDRSKSPATMDYYNTQGTNAGKIQRGIYELDGATLKLCLGAPEGDRPAEFASKPGDGRTFVVWNRK
jgi:uncharacterized protein (TIGR03067 family)